MDDLARKFHKHAPAAIAAAKGRKIDMSHPAAQPMLELAREKCAGRRVLGLRVIEGMKSDPWKGIAYSIEAYLDGCEYDAEGWHRVGITSIPTMFPMETDHYGPDRYCTKERGGCDEKRASGLAAGAFCLDCNKLVSRWDTYEEIAP